MVMMGSGHGDDGGVVMVMMGSGHGDDGHGDDGEWSW